MSTAPTPGKGQKAKKDKDKEKEKEKKVQPPNERLKTVVRRLPPNLPEEIFWQSVQPWVTEETVTWKAFYPGKVQKKLNKENIPARAYIAFKNEEQLALFSRDYDGHIFRDKTGAESQAIVEFAPYPKIPSEKRKPDNRNGTIEKDEDYISFVESLKASENAEPVSLESLIAASQPPPPPKTTPLLEALKAEKSANRDKEAILRNHAHYNQIALASRKDDKKKAAPSTPATKQAEAAAASAAGGKKAGKKAQAQAAAAAQNAKAAAAVSQASKDASTTNASTNQGGKPGKARPPRPTPSAKQQATDIASASPAVTAVPSTPVSSANPPSSTTDGQAPAPAAAPPRRTRPVLGLGSRQFEAALSGVAGLAGAATERKRREKEKEAQSQSTSVGSAASPAAPTVPPPPASVPSMQYARIDGSDTEKPSSPVPPPSPKRNRRSARGGASSGGSVAGPVASGPAEGPQVKVPSILNRADAPPPGLLQKDALALADAAPASVNLAGGSTRGSSGGRRGRGGGRGRGGPPHALRGG